MRSAVFTLGRMAAAGLWLAVLPIAEAGQRDGARAPGSARLLDASDFSPLRGVGAHQRGSDAGGAWLRFEAEGPGATAAVGTPAPLAAPLDLRGRFVALRARVEHAERLAGAELVLASRDGAFVLPVPVFADETMNLLRSGEWIWLTLGLGSARREGSPDRSAIAGVEWRLAERAGPGPRLGAQVGALEARPAPAEGVVSLTFDDGYDEHFAAAAPLLAEHGFRATAYAMPEQVGEQGYMTLEQLHALRRNFGWDVAAHHFTPLVEFAGAERARVLDALQGYLGANGFGAGARHLAYPLGKYDAGLLALVRSRFATARLAAGGAETLPPADPHRLRAWNVLDSTAPEAIAEAARRAHREGEWLILMFHFLVERPQRETEYAVAELRRALAGIAASGASVKTVSEVWREIEAGASPAATSGGAPAAPSRRRGGRSPRPPRRACRHRRR
jgi:peptidoglycan/xylan/chitin deacetylase (PgdA/CDA1 family)